MIFQTHAFPPYGVHTLLRVVVSYPCFPAYGLLKTSWGRFRAITLRLGVVYVTLNWRGCNDPRTK
jgi:hypothetical protein